MRRHKKSAPAKTLLVDLCDLVLSYLHARRDVPTAKLNLGIMWSLYCGGKRAWKKLGIHLGLSWA